MFAAAGDAEVDELGEGEEGGDGVAVGGGDDLDSLGGEGGDGGGGGVDHGGRDEAVGVEGFLTAAEDGGVTGFEAETGGVGGDVGAGFVDDDDDTDGDGDFLQAKAVGAGAVVEQAADGIGEVGDFANALGHGEDAFGVETEAVEQGGGETEFAAGLEVLGVRLEQGRGGGDEGIGHGAEGQVFLIGGEAGDAAGGLFGIGGELLHLLGKRHWGVEGSVGGWGATSLGFRGWGGRLARGGKRANHAALRSGDRVTTMGVEPTIKPHRRLLALLRPERRDIGLILLFSAVAGLFHLATPLAVDAVVNNISFGGQQPVYLQSLLILAGVLLVFLMALAVISAVQYFVVELLQQRIFVRLAADFACRLPRLQFGALESTRRPELVNRFLDVVTVQKSSAYLMLDGVNVALGTVIGLLVLAFYHPFLLAFDIVLIGALLLVLFPLGRHGVRTSIQESYAKHAVAGWLEQVVMFPLLFKSTAAAELARERADRLVDTYITARRAHFRVLLRQILGLLGLEALASALLLALGGLLVLRGQLTLGQLVSSELIVSAIVASMVRLSKHLENWYDALAAIDKLGGVVDLPVERTGGEGPVAGEGPSPLELEEVGFSYPGARPLFEGIRFRVSPGEHVAVTGPIGSGAGTLLELIYGLRVPSEGLIRVRGVDVRAWSLESLRAEVGFVRDLDFVEGTLLENVCLGRADLAPVEVQRVLERVGLGPLLGRTPEGLNLRLQPGGRPLSDSQRVLAALARAILSGPKVLLIDKVLDGMDARESEAVLSWLFGEETPWTVVVATRDERILRRCSRVYRLRADGLQTGVGH